MRFCAALVARKLDLGDAAKGKERRVEDLFGYSIVEAAWDVLEGAAIRGGGGKRASLPTKTVDLRRVVSDIAAWVMSIFLDREGYRWLVR